MKDALGRIKERSGQVQLNMTTDYAIRFLIYLGREKGTIRGGEIAESMCIPPKYLLKIARRLREAGMIGAIEGAKGGYYLRRPLDQLPLLDVLRVMEPTMMINRCLEPDHYCSRGMEAGCPVRRYYARMQREMEERWLSKTLAQILEMGTGGGQEARDGGQSRSGAEKAPEIIREARGQMEAQPGQ